MKKITMDDIIAFVMKAMNKSMKVRRESRNWISVCDDDNKNIFNFIAHGNEIDVNTKRGCYNACEFSQKDMARWNVLCEEVEEHESNEAYSCFKNFFVEDDKNKITDINELNEDD